MARRAALTPASRVCAQLQRAESTGQAAFPVQCTSVYIGGGALSAQDRQLEGAFADLRQAQPELAVLGALLAAAAPDAALQPVVRVPPQCC